MSNVNQPSALRAALSLRSDPTSTRGRSLEMSPSRSSVRSSSSQSQAQTPASSVPDTPLLFTRSPFPEGKPSLTADSDFFLTALAAQERRVLELREELHKAEEDLEKLKKHWAVHEFTKTKRELRHLQQQQPLNNLLLGSSMPSSDNDSVNASKELDGRKITSSSIRHSHRKVFAGSRHTRALSLVPSKDPRSRSDLLLPGNGPPKVRHAAATDTAAPATARKPASSTLESGPQKDAIMETGKQLIGDFRQGLWTFLEDFKQLTVGDEGIGSAGLRTLPARNAGNIPRRQIMKERRTTLKDNLARKAGALDVMREPWEGPQTEAPSPKQRFGSALDRFLVGPTSIPVGFISDGGNDANSSDSDANGWDNWDNPKGPTQWHLLARTEAAQE